MIRVVLPVPLRTLAGISGEIEIPLRTPATIAAVLDALEERYPVLCGTIRDRETGRRRPFLRFFAGEVDLSLAEPQTLLPPSVSVGSDPFVVLGAIAGG